MKLEKLTKLTEDIIEPKKTATRRFIGRWTHGDMEAANSTVAPDVMAELKQTVQENSYKLYRGWKFHDAQDMYQKLGNAKLTEGSTFQINTDKLRSWSKSRHVAEMFSNPRIDTKLGRALTDHEIEDMGFEHGELLAITVIIEATISKDHILADLTNIPQEIMAHAHDEQEVIVLPGSYMVTIISLDSHHHSSPDHFYSKDVNRITVSVIQNRHLSRDTFTSNFEKATSHGGLTVEAIIALMMIYGFKNENEFNHIKSVTHLIHNKDSSENAEILAKLTKYISTYHKTGKDPLDISNDFRHLNEPEKVHHDHEVDDEDFDLGDWEAEDDGNDASTYDKLMSAHRTP